MSLVLSLHFSFALSLVLSLVFESSKNKTQYPKFNLKNYKNKPKFNYRKDAGAVVVVDHLPPCGTVHKTTAAGWLPTTKASYRCYKLFFGVQWHTVLYGPIKFGLYGPLKFFKFALSPHLSPHLSPQ